MNRLIQNSFKWLVLAALICLALPAPAQNASRNRIPENLTTGPAVGDRIPIIEAVDQQGQRRDFDDIVGPAGAMILFYRSADW